MGTPLETTNAVKAEDASAVPANENTCGVVPLREVENAFNTIENKVNGLKATSMSNMPTSFADLETTIIHVRQQLTRAAVEAVWPVTGGTVEIRSDAPAVIVRRSIGEAISRGDLRPGQKLPGQDMIFVTAWEPVNRSGNRLGREIASFGAPENLPGGPQTFNSNAASIAELKNWHGHDGWVFDRARYETASYEDSQFKGYQDGSAFGSWGIPELPALNGQDRDRNLVIPAANMLALNKDKTSPFYYSFVTIPGSDAAKWSQSCTEHRGYPGSVRSVHFPVGRVSWDGKDFHRSCVRPVVALELKHLIL